MYRLLIPSAVWSALDEHLRGAGPSEDGAFLLLREGRGRRDTRLIVHELMLPPRDAWEARGQHRLRPSGQWLSAVIGTAIETNSGLGFVHSHPDAAHPPSLSGLDRSTSIDWSRSLTPTLGRPFLSLVWTPSAVTGLVFQPTRPEEPRLIERIESLGNLSSLWVHPRKRAVGGDVLDDRQARALGMLGNARLRQLHVGLVGLGGTGSPLAEQLARMGVGELTLIDADTLDTESNLRRIVGSTMSDLTARTPKVAIVERHIAAMGLGTTVHALAIDVRREEAAKALLDTDVVISSTDTHSSRSFVNQLAFQYFLPVLDVGARVGLSAEGMVSGMPAEVRVLLPDKGCLWCRGVLDARAIRAENLPAAERDAEVREGYIQGLAGPQPSLAALNYFASSLSVLSLLRFLSGDRVGAQSFIGDGWERYFVDRPDNIDTECICAQWRALGDEVRLSYLPNAATPGARLD